MSIEPTEFSNFGRNIQFRPRTVAAPETEAEVLELLRQHAGRRIRVIGHLHSWSDAAFGDDVIVNLRHLNSVSIEQTGAGIRVTAGAGCQIKRLLEELERKAGVTLRLEHTAPAETVFRTTLPKSALRCTTLSRASP
jgi:FAD/FMN-containing dehydrogenase